MLEKLKSAFKKKPSTSSLRYIRWYSVFVVLSATLYLVMLIVDWYLNGKPNLNAMKDFLTLVLSGSAVAAITFAATWLADNNNNGIPDALEKDVSTTDTSTDNTSSNQNYQ